jgi:hypothetical protein
MTDAAIVHKNCSFAASSLHSVRRTVLAHKRTKEGRKEPAASMRRLPSLLTGMAGARILPQFGRQAPGLSRLLSVERPRAWMMAFGAQRMTVLPNADPTRLPSLPTPRPTPQESAAPVGRTVHSATSAHAPPDAATLLLFPGPRLLSPLTLMAPQRSQHRPPWCEAKYCSQGVQPATRIGPQDFPAKSPRHLSMRPCPTCDRGAQSICQQHGRTCRRYASFRKRRRRA